MDNKHDILELLRRVAEGSVTPEEAMLDLKEEPFFFRAAAVKL